MAQSCFAEEQQGRVGGCVGKRQSTRVTPREVEGRGLRAVGRKHGRDKFTPWPWLSLAPRETPRRLGLQWPVFRVLLPWVGFVTCVGIVEGGAPAQRPARPAPDLYHWVLPVDQPGVDVAMLHPNDCYVVQRADGTATFGVVSSDVTALQARLGPARAHLVPDAAEHPECTREACVVVDALAQELETRLERESDRRLRRSVRHRPTPLDNFFGGAYTDVGSAERATYRNAREQRMIARHLATTARGNCYEARLPRQLSIHVRDQDVGRVRTGVYHGYLYIEHHHPDRVGDSVAGGEE